MDKCSLGLGWNLSGGLRERVTPSQMHFASGLCHVRRHCFIAVTQPSESIMGLFKGACESKSPYYVMGLFSNPPATCAMLPLGKVLRIVLNDFKFKGVYEFLESRIQFYHSGQKHLLGLLHQQEVSNV